MTEPYLILHKVRGEPAYDVAYQMDIGGELGWLIPTSGHRAYPITQLRLLTITPESFKMMKNELEYDYGNPWHNLPDHYAASERRSMLATAASDILSLMGLKPKAPAPVKRRSIPNG